MLIIGHPVKRAWSETPILHEVRSEVEGEEQEISLYVAIVNLFVNTLNWQA